MDHSSTTCDQWHEVRGLTQFACDGLDAGQAKVNRLATCSDDLLALLRQSTYEMSTDEAACAKNQDVIIHAKSPRAACGKS